MIDQATTNIYANLETFKLWLNFAASIGMTLSLGSFLIFVFGRDNSLAHRLPAYKTWMLKTGLSMCSAGALLNAVTFSNPGWSEVLLNGGLCVVFAWAAWFHYNRFVKPWQKDEKGSKKKAKTKKKS